jgi:hypothetical protein
MCDLAFSLDDRRNIGTIVEKRYVSLLISPSIALPGQPKLSCTMGPGLVFIVLSSPMTPSLKESDTSEIYKVNIKLKNTLVVQSE